MDVVVGEVDQFLVDRLGRAEAHALAPDHPLEAVRARIGAAAVGEDPDIAFAQEGHPVPIQGQQMLARNRQVVQALDQGAVAVITTLPSGPRQGHSGAAVHRLPRRRDR